MIKVDRLRDDSEKRILRCSDGNSIWYQLWIDTKDMMSLWLILGEDSKRNWCIPLQKYYVFFYEVRKGKRILGEDRIEEILDTVL